MKKIMALLALCFFVLASCVPEFPKNQLQLVDKTPESSFSTGGIVPRNGGTVIRAITTEPPTLDPKGAAGSGQNVILPYMLDTLIYRDTDNSYKPYLAEEWEISEDGKTIVFDLKKGIKFHDGTYLNAEAVVFTYKRAMEKGSKSPLVSSLSNIEKIEAVSESRVVFRLKEFSSTLFSSLSTAYAGIISPSAVEKSGDQFGLNPIGSGPFKFDSWKPGESITLVRNENYAWGPEVLKNKGAPYLDELIFKVIPDATAQSTAFQSGEIDIFFINQPSQISIFESDPSARLVETSMNALVYLSFNCKVKPFDDPIFRRAIAHALDKQELVKLALNGIGNVVFSPLSPTLPGFDPKLESLEPRYDLKKAEELLTKSGYARQTDGSWLDKASNKTLQLEILTSTRAPNVTLATIIQEQLNRINIKVTIRALDATAANTEATKGNYMVMLWRYDWSDSDVLAVYLTSSRIGATNRTFYGNSEVDKLLSNAAKEVDLAKRNGFYSEAQQLLMQDLPWIPLYAPKDYLVIRRQVEQVIIGIMGRVVLTDAWVK